MSKTLVIGAGLVGSQIARILVDDGETPVLLDPAAQPAAIAEVVPLDRVTLVKGDVLRPIDITRAILDHGVTDVVHTAANPLLTRGAQTDPLAAIQLNIMGTVNVLEAVRAHKLRRIVTSSSNVLNHFLEGGQGAGDARREDAFPRPTTFYASTKQAVENLGLNYARWLGLDFAAMRYGAVCGPWSGAGGGGPSNTFRILIEKALAGEEVEVPPNDMEWVYAVDAARGTVQALRAASLGGRVFNITMGVVTKADDLAAAIRDVLPDARLRMLEPDDVDVSLTRHGPASDLAAARQCIGYAPEFQITEAVAAMVSWLRDRRHHQPAGLIGA